MMEGMTHPRQKGRKQSIMNCDRGCDNHCYYLWWCCWDDWCDTLNPSVTKVWSSGVEAELFTSNPFSSTTCHYYEDYLHLIVLLQHHLVPSLIILSFDHIIKGKPSNRIFGKNLDFVPTEGGVCQSQLFQTKTITIQKGDFVAIWQGFPSPNQKITKTWDFFMKRIICLE